MPGPNHGREGPDWWRHGDAVVRPFGYGHDDTIARRIGDRDLFVGNAAAAESRGSDHSFERVLSLTADPRQLTTHHRPLVDGPDNEWADFEAAADTARHLLGERSLLIHCSHGISRSAAVAAVAVAAAESRSFRETLALVRSARPPATVHPTLREQACWYLAKK